MASLGTLTDRGGRRISPRLHSKNSQNQNVSACKEVVREEGREIAGITGVADGALVKKNAEEQIQVAEVQQIDVDQEDCTIEAPVLMVKRKLGRPKGSTKAKQVQAIENEELGPGAAIDLVDKCEHFKYCVSQ